MLNAPDSALDVTGTNRFFRAEYSTEIDMIEMSCFRWFICLAVTTALLGSGCKPPEASSKRRVQQEEHPTEDASSQPEAEDLASFLRSTLPPVMKLTEVNSDPPVPMPNTSPSQRVWLINTKIVLTPAEDLLGLPPAEDAHAIDALMDELNGLIDWRNAFAKTPYARTCPVFDVKPPVLSVPQLLVVRQLRQRV